MTNINMTNIMQGDQYAVPFKITYTDDETGEKVIATPELISDVEICIGDIKKNSPDVSYNNNKEVWEFPLTQEETFSIAARRVKVQARILLSTGDVIGREIGYLVITDSISKEVL